MHRKLKDLTSFVLLLALTTGYANAANDIDKPCSHIWSKEAKKIGFAYDDHRTKKAFSPDGKSSIQLSHKGVFFITGNKTRQLKFDDTRFYPQLMEVLWSDDSRRFAFSIGEGVLYPSLDLYVYEIDDESNLKRLNLPRKAKQIIENFSHCEGGYSTNVGPIKWENEGKSLVIGLEVQNNSSCKNLGSTMGMEVTFAPSEFIEKFTRKELRTRYPNLLGCMFSSR